MTFAALFLVWCSGGLSMGALLSFAERQILSALGFMMLAIAFLVPAAVEVFAR